MSLTAHCRAALIAVTLLAGGCGHGSPSSDAEPAAGHPRSPRDPATFPFSMLGVPDEAVAAEVRARLAVLGSYSRLGLQEDGTIIGCDIAPNRDMAMSMAIVGVMWTIRKVSVQPDTPDVEGAKPGRATDYPEMVLKGASSVELPGGTGETLCCIQAQPTVRLADGPPGKPAT